MGMRRGGRTTHQLTRSQARNLILGHAGMVDLYRREFQPEQKGRIGITLVSSFL